MGINRAIRVTVGAIAMLSMAAVILLVSASAVSAAAPLNDDFVDSFDLGGGMAAGQNGSTVDATTEVDEPNPSAACGTNVAGKTVWWSWTAPTSGSVMIDTIGSGFDTVLAVYTGREVDALTGLACNDDIGGGTGKQFKVAARFPK